ncbi:hypothetical protein [uncultured Friedmanniella sp.]|uniref:hypothetical protein n=1 Tax=uncultured Friedmanniella sp. TaxID=335381 RepID=UPI0035CA453A
MDLNAAAEELYGGSPDDFVERRTALVVAARKARERELVLRIGALRRPTRTAWLVNVLAREASSEVGELLELGEALADAQRRGSGADLRRLSADRRRLVDRLARQAVTLGAAHGYTAPDAALQEVSQTLQAALGDDDTREQLRAGRLTTAVSYGGFGPFTMPEAAPEPPPVEAAPVEAAPKEPPVDKLKERENELQEQRDRLGELAEAAQRAEAEAQRQAEEATARADELADRIEELRGELAAAEGEEREAREAARAARRQLLEARQAATEAEQAVVSARSGSADITPRGAAATERF